MGECLCRVRLIEFIAWAMLVGALAFFFFACAIHRLRKGPVPFSMAILLIVPPPWVLIPELRGGVEGIRQAIENVSWLPYGLVVYSVEWLVLLCLCVWIDVMNFMEFFRRKEETPSPPSTPAA
jgi:hypothetical protein